MGKEKRNVEEWIALAKVLCKLQLIDEASYQERFAITADQVPPSEPIALGASQDLFEEGDAISLIAQHLGVEKYDLSDPSTAFSAKQLLDQFVDKIPVEKWKEIKAVPVLRDRGGLHIAYANPLARDSKQQIDFLLGESSRVAVASEAQILSFMCGGSVKEIRATTRSVDGISLDSIGASKLSPSIGDSDSSTVNVDAAPIVRLVNKMFLDSFERGASDIHISPEKSQLSVKIRADGVMTELMTVPANVSGSVISRIKLLAGMDISEKRRPQDGRIRINILDSHKDLRVSTVPTLYGENVVARVLNSDLTSISFDKLGMPSEVLHPLTKDLSGTSQVILVTGPTGSGKTSSLYAAITQLKDGQKNIITIEDPIEYRVNGITQIQVNSKIGMTFAEAIRSVLRQDPDVVVVGEVRDNETATTAMQAAQTGHLVLATLHANSAPAAITRLLDLEIPSYLVSSSIRGVLAQRLVRKLCPFCAIPDTRDSTYKLLSRLGRDASPKIAKGCGECSDAGFKGRTGLYSYLPFTEEVKGAVRDQRGEAEVERLARLSGYRSLEEMGIELISSGVSSYDEVTRVLGEIAPTDLSTALHDNSESGARAEPLPDAVLTQPLRDKLRKKRVLLVEDDENLRQVISMTLERAKFEVLQAKNGVDALARIATDIPDIVVCDLMMPEMDGAETVQRLRGDNATRRIPILMLTSADTCENELKLIECGADDFVSKAAGRKIFLSRVNRLLERVYG